MALSAEHQEELANKTTSTIIKLEFGPLPPSSGSNDDKLEPDEEILDNEPDDVRLGDEEEEETAAVVDDDKKETTTTKEATDPIESDQIIREEEM